MLAKPIAYTIAATFMIAAIDASAETATAPSPGDNAAQSAKGLAQAQHQEGESGGNAQTPTKNRKIHRPSSHRRTYGSTCRHGCSRGPRPAVWRGDWGDGYSFGSDFDYALGSFNLAGSNFFFGDLDQGIAVCARSFSSFNPATGCYMSHTGPRPCPYLYQQ